MKKILFFGLVLLAPFYANAQQVKFGLEVGMNSSQTIASDNTYKTDGRVSGMQIGLTADYSLSEKWILMSGLSFVQKGGQLTQEPLYYSKEGSYAANPTKLFKSYLNYIELPLKLGFSFNVGEKLRLIPNIGVYAAYGFNGKSSPLAIYRYSDVTKQGNYSFESWKPFNGHGDKDGGALSKYERFDLGGIVGVKAIVADHFTASFNYSHGITQAQQQISARNSSLQLSVGYQF